MNEYTVKSLADAVDSLPDADRRLRAMSRSDTPRGRLLRRVLEEREARRELARLADDGCPHHDD